jgi:hypothetical protein
MSKFSEKFMVDHVTDVWATIMFPEFIEHQKYRLLLYPIIFLARTVGQNPSATKEI